jgi:chromosomal replication initiator protein
VDHLENAAAQQRGQFPADGPALDRLLRYVEQNRPLLADIKAAVCDLYNITPGELMGDNRLYEKTFARQAFCFLAKRYTKYSLNVIAHHVGLTNHTTVIHAVRKIEKWSLTRPLVADDLDLLRLKISERMLMRRKDCTSC